MVEIKIVESRGKEPIKVIGNSIEHCINIMLDKGIIDEGILSKRKRTYRQPYRKDYIS